MERLQAELRAMRPALLTMAILLFVIMLVEVDLGHRPALAQGNAWLALIPVVWLPVALIALIAVQWGPSLPTMLAALAVMAVSAAVGMAGSGLHMMAAGVDLAHLDRVFSSAVWGGPVSPNWPVAITVAAVLGFIAAFGAAGERAMQATNALGLVNAVADILIIGGVGGGTWPAFLAISAACLVAAALMLLAALVGTLAQARMQGSSP